MNRSLVVVLAGVVAGIAACGDEASRTDAAQAEPVDSTVAFSVAEADLLPENVAYDPVDATFFLGSTRKGKIVRIRRDGSVDDFVGPRQDGLWMVIGMKVDPIRRVLWVCSSDGDNLEGGRERTAGSAGVFQFDLDSGRLLARSTLADGTASHFFNDLVLSPAGDAYVTHMFDEPAIYRIRAGSDRLERLAALAPESYPNGIAFGPGGNLLVATSAGLVSIDTATAAIAAVASPEGISTRGIDGLYAAGDLIFAVRPDAGEVRRYRLAPDQRSIVESSVVLTGHPAFSNATTGVLVADTLFVVANSHFQLVGPDGSLPDSAALTPPAVLRVRLR